MSVVFRGRSGVGHGVVMVCVVGGFASPGSASARPQWSVSTQVEVEGTGTPERPWSITRWTLGMRAEELLLRAHPADWGFGPLAELRTTSFMHTDAGGGAIFLVPFSEDFPVWATAQIFGRTERGSWRAGSGGSLTWGPRSYNYTSDYAMAFGLIVDARFVPAVHRGPAEVELTVGLSLDLALLALPMVVAVAALHR